MLYAIKNFKRHSSSQEPKTDKDDEYARKINELMNNPPAPGSQRSAGSTPNPALGSEITNLRDSDIQNLFGNISQQQLMQILGSGMSSLATLLGPGLVHTTQRVRVVNSCVHKLCTAATEYI